VTFFSEAALRRKYDVAAIIKFDNTSDNNTVSGNDIDVLRILIVVALACEWFSCNNHAAVKINRLFFFLSKNTCFRGLVVLK
jgi:hypothetical protein